MDISLVIRERLRELGLDQKDLAAAAAVTESYISQLLARKKAPPAPNRTDVYEKFGRLLKLPAGELAKLAELQREGELRKKLAGPAKPLFQECRQLVLRKCAAARRAEVRRIFEKEPFGELERLVTQKLLDVAQAVVKQELSSEEWQRRMATAMGHSYEQARVAVLEFLDTEVLDVSVETCVVFLDPIIKAWDIDLKTFQLEFVLSPRLAPGRRKRFEFVEQPAAPRASMEPGLEQFLKDRALSGDATPEEIEFLRALKFEARRPTPLYYYRELQSLRDPLHFQFNAR
jgi:transcriptional regulator with XRE-family HTH domain